MAEQGDFWKLEHLSDAELIESLGGVLRTQQRTLAELIAHLGEIDERRLHLAAAYPSLFDYCVSRLHMSEDEACRRIELARLSRRFPALFPLIASGELTLSVALLLKPVLTLANQGALMSAVRGKTIRQARETLATLFPGPDVPSKIRKLPEPLPRKPAVAREIPLPVAPASLPPSEKESAAKSPAPSVAATTNYPPTLMLAPHPSRSRIEPIATQRYKVQFTADASLKEKLEIARDLLRHTYPDGDLGSIVSRALDLLIADVKRTRFGVGAHPKAARHVRSRATPAASESVSSNASSSNASSHAPCCVSRATRRAVLKRDGLACSWVDESGKRCGSRAWLELDHRYPRGKGGGSEPPNVRILCRAHNQLTAELAYGREHMARAKEARRKQRGQTRCSPATNSPDG